MLSPRGVYIVDFCLSFRCTGWAGQAAELPQYIIQPYRCRKASFVSLQVRDIAVEVMQFRGHKFICIVLHRRMNGTVPRSFQAFGNTTQLFHRLGHNRLIGDKDNFLAG